MIYTQYGTIIDSGFPDPSGRGNEAFMPVKESVLLSESGTMPIELKTPGVEAEALALHMAGLVHGGKEYLSVVFVCSWVDMGMIVHDVLSANDASGNAQGQRDFLIGLNMTPEQREKFINDTRKDRD